MVVVTIIGLLAAIALPALQSVQQSAQNSRFVSDLRTYAQAFETYAMEHGTWPTSTITRNESSALTSHNILRPSESSNG